MRDRLLACSRSRPGLPSGARILLTLIALQSMAAPAAGMQLAGPWRITHGVAAPWANQTSEPLPNAGLRGSRLEFAANRVVGPAPLACTRATYEFVVVPAEGLFQGSVEDPTGAAARTLGVDHVPVMTLQVSCDSGVFDYHLIGPDTLLTALDNVVWTLTTAASATGPEAVVQRLLAQHMTRDMGFTAGSVQPKRQFLSPALGALIAAYFERAVPEDEPPPISGDPITNSQEYPSRFTLGRAVIRGASARVPVVFSDGSRQRPVEVLLRRAGGRWLVDDLRYEDGSTFRELLSAS